MTKIPHAKLLFVLDSKVCVSNYWPAICKMDNFTSAIYDIKTFNHTGFGRKKYGHSDGYEIG
jgi:hypothetical protein